MRILLYKLLLVLVIASPLGVGAQQGGVPFLHNFEPSVYKASPQNWGITQLNSGEIVVANDYGCLVYNGRQWLLFEEEVNYISGCLSDNSGRVLIGSENDIKELDTDSLGQLQFISVLDDFPDTMRDFGIVEQIVDLPEKFCFHTDNYVFIRDREGWSWAYSESLIKRIFIEGNSLFVSTEDRGLTRFENGQLVHTMGYRLFIDNYPIAIWSKDKKHLNILTENQGLFEAQLDGFGYMRRVEKLESSIDTLFDNRSISGMWTLDEDRVLLATQSSGIYVIKDWNQIVEHSSLQSGLQDELVHDAYLDEYGTVWLALSNGISKIELDYPVRIYDSRVGLEGTVEDLEYVGEELLAATHSGLYRVSPDEQSFRNIYPEQVWDIQTVNGSEQMHTLIATNYDISSLLKDDKVQPVVECYPWKMHAVSFDSSSVLVGTDPGLLTLKHDGSSWIVGQENKEVYAAINNFLEFADEIWMGSRKDETYRLDSIYWIEDSTVYEGLTAYYADHGLPDTEQNIIKWKNELYVGTAQGVFQKDEVDTFLQVEISDEVDINAHFHRAKITNRSELWLALLVENNFQLGFLDTNSHWNYRMLNPLAKDVVHAIQQDKYGNVLLGGAAGMFQVKNLNSFNERLHYSCNLTKISVLEDSLIHGGFWKRDSGFVFDQDPNLIPEFHYKTNAIAFEFATVTFGLEEDVRYSYWLEGNDKNWSKWTREHKKEYTNLPPGKYKFKVKARNIFETESEVASYSFVINKPWFQTPLYYAAQTAVLLLLVLLTVFTNRSGQPTAFANIIAFVTIITVFEFIIMTVEPYFVEYTGEIPVFNLLMNVLMAASLAPIEKLIQKFLSKRHHD